MKSNLAEIAQTTQIKLQIQRVISARGHMRPRKQNCRFCDFSSCGGLFKGERSKKLVHRGDVPEINWLPLSI
jgi:hypothetical protein